MGLHTSQVTGQGEPGQVEGRGHLVSSQLGEAVHGPHELQLGRLALKRNGVSGEPHGGPGWGWGWFLHPGWVPPGVSAGRELGRAPGVGSIRAEPCGDGVWWGRAGPGRGASEPEPGEKEVGRSRVV